MLRLVQNQICGSVPVGLLQLSIRQGEGAMPQLSQMLLDAEYFFSGR